jgi:hypothetical protein
MKGDNMFGGRIPECWTPMLPEHLAQLTSQKLRVDTQPGGVLETFLQMVNIVSACQPVPVNLSPDKSKVQNPLIKQFLFLIIALPVHFLLVCFYVKKFIIIVH